MTKTVKNVHKQIKNVPNVPVHYYFWNKIPAQKNVQQLNSETKQHKSANYVIKIAKHASGNSIITAKVATKVIFWIL